MDFWFVHIDGLEFEDQKYLHYRSLRLARDVAAIYALKYRGHKITIMRGEPASSCYSDPDGVVEWTKTKIPSVEPDEESHE